MLRIATAVLIDAVPFEICDANLPVQADKLIGKSIEKP
jgi:hypothetical protein